MKIETLWWIAVFSVAFCLILYQILPSPLKEIIIISLTLIIIILFIFKMGKE